MFNITDFTRATGMATYKTHCDLCPLKFTTTSALLKHILVKHAASGPVKCLPFYLNDAKIQVPSGRRTTLRSGAYKQWLTGITESVNFTFHPKVAGNATASVVVQKELFTIAKHCLDGSA